MARAGQSSANNGPAARRLREHAATRLLLGLALTAMATTIACTKTANNHRSEKEEPKVSLPNAIVELQSLLPLSRAELRAKLGIEAADEPRSYERLEGLTMIFEHQASPARFYFSGDALVMIYVEDDEFAAKLDLAAVRSALGKPLTLQSRAGKDHIQEVYPAAGLAVSSDESTIDFLEIFAPMAAEEYRTRVYDDPGTFYK